MDMDSVSYNEKPWEFELEYILSPTGFAESSILDWVEKDGMPNH